MNTNLINILMTTSSATFKHKIKDLYATEINNVRDQYGNTLLHLAVEKSSPDLVQILLDKNVLTDVKNKFDETAWTLALMIRNNTIIEKFINHQINELKRKIVSNESLHEEINVLKSDLNIIKIENKRFRDENDELKQSNKKLKISVQNLIDSNKK